MDLKENGLQQLVAKNTINIVSASDNLYAEHLCVMISSLFGNAGEYNIHVHVIATVDFVEIGNFSESLRECLSSITVHHVSTARIDNLKTWSKVPPSVYLRLLMSEVLPQNINRIIYLDADLILLGSLDELWDVDLNGAWLGAVLDDLFQHQLVLGFESNEPYFNSGVMLVDLDAWRREEIGVRALNFAREYPGRITWGDQCALNWVTRGQWLEVEKRWNVQSIALGRTRNLRFQFYRKVPRDLARESRAIHFTGVPDPGTGKPWSYMSEHPYKWLYWRYLQRTSWKRYYSEDFTFKNVMRKLALRYFPLIFPIFRVFRKLLERLTFWNFHH